MKIKKQLTLAISMALIITTVVITALLNNNSTTDVEYAPTLSQQITEVRYVLKLYNGKIAVFREGDELPEQITDISEYSLCNYDRDQLSVGVSVLGDIELAMRLEDYGS